MGVSWSQCQWTGWIPQKAGNPPALWVIQLVSACLAKKTISTPVAAVLGPFPPCPGAGSAQGWWGWACLPGCVGLPGCWQLHKSQILTLLQWGLAWIWGNKCSCITVCQGFVPTNQLCSQLRDEMRSRFIASVCVLQVFRLAKLEAGSVINFFFSGIVLIS